ncbi:MAG: ATP-binding protein [Bacteroidales bacterium]|jgi:two-component system nitrogen regulation sensor histidine kinase NtrY|nr:ATP-binding protein [Bacteroidales bacterium]
MIYKNFKVNLTLRILLITATIFLLFYSVKINYFVTPFIIGLTIIIQIVLLINFINKTNRDLASFLESIRFSEFKRSFQVEGMGSSFDELNKAFNQVINDFQKIRSEKEEQYHYLRNLVQNIDVSIISYQKNGKVDMVNKSFRKLFQIGYIKNIHELEIISHQLSDALMNFDPAQNQLIKIQEEDAILQLAISGTLIKIQDKEIFLVTIKNIQNVLEDQETQTWQKLISVLTHEIMNSITPIASIASSLELLIKDIKNNEFDQEITEDIHLALNTIHKRSTGLLHFVNTYRDLTKIPIPNFKITKINEILNDIKPLMNAELKENIINFSTSVSPKDIEIYSDTKLIEQVLINLIKNAIHALENNENKIIHLKGYFNKRGRPAIQIFDNGQGILNDVIDKIFIPFFTTKTKGSGIGLSLSKQIMRLHGGAITVNSEPEKGTTFTLTF